VAGGIDQIILDEPSNSLIGVSNGSVFVIPDGANLGAADELAVDVKGHTLAKQPKRLFAAPLVEWITESRPQASQDTLGLTPQPARLNMVADLLGLDQRRVGRRVRYA